MNSFRDFEKSLCILWDRACINILDPDQVSGANGILCYGYVDHAAGLTFEGLALVSCMDDDYTIVLDNDEIFSFLKKRKGMLEGVVVTGGEPTINRDLIPFLSSLKDLGYLVKLDTNGYRPDVLRQAVEKGVVDYVAMDIKTSLDEYPKLCGVENIDTSRIKESIDYLMTGVVDYEFRTTVVEPLHHEENFKKIGQITKGCRRYFLQSFVESGNILGKNCFPPSSGQLQNYLEILSSYIENVSIRDRG